MTVFIILALLMAIPALIWLMLRSRNLDIWLPQRAAQHVRNVSFSTEEKSEELIDVMFCIADHFEPGWNNAGHEVQRRRVRTWVESFPALADKHRDFDGRATQ